MQRYLATAAVFPGLYLAWNAHNIQNPVFAKSSSKSSSSKSSFSSKSSSSSSSSSSSKSSFFSRKSGSTGLTNKSSFRSSSISSKPYARTVGKKSYINKRRYVKDQQRNKQMSIVGLFSLLGLVTRYFYRYERLRYGMRYIKNALNSCQTTNLSSYSSALDGKLVYGHGPILVHAWQNKLLRDNMFGVEASSPDCIRLHRVVEIFKEHEDSSKSKWYNPQYIKMFHPEIFHPSMKERIILPEEVEIGEYKLSEDQLIAFGQGKEKIVAFETDVVDETYQEIQDNSQEKKTGRFSFKKTKQDKSEPGVVLEDLDKPDTNKVIEEYRIIERLMSGPTQSDNEIMNVSHPFSYANRQGKEIIFQEDSIFIVNDIDNPQDGDMRIAFQEIRPLLHATVIAQQKGTSFTDYEIKELKNLKLNLKLFVGGKEQDAKFDVVNIIKEGKIEKDDLIKEYLNNVKSQSNLISKVLAWIIYLVYVAIFDQIGQMINPFNWFGKGAEQRRQQNKQVVQKKGSGYTFSKSNSGFLSSVLAIPFAGAHIGSVSLFALARSFAGVLCGGAVGGYLIYTLYKDYYDDKQLINSFGENEEEEIDNLDFEVDHTEQEILQALQNSEIKDK